MSDTLSLLVAHRPVNDLAKKEPRPKVGCEPMNEEAASSELSLAVAVARRYYLHDESKVDIARFLGVSRFKVARLLSLARSSGLVHVEIREPREMRETAPGRAPRPCSRRRRACNRWSGRRAQGHHWAISCRFL